MIVLLPQMVIPIGFERESNKTYEEVNIPATDSAPAEVGRRLVPISSLDEVSKAG